MAGGPGSGKTYIAGEIFGIPQNFNSSVTTSTALGLKSINSDREFEFFVKKYGYSLDLNKIPDEDKDKVYGTGADSLRTRSKKITYNRRINYIEGRLGLIIDGTGRNYNDIKQQKEILEDLGYDTYLIFVNTSLETAIKRNANRDRKIPKEIVINSWHEVQNNIGKFQNLFGSNNIQIIDNNNEKKGNTDSINKAYKIVTKWIKSPIKNIIAKRWIESEKNRRGIK